jgi:hypothetical protein
VTPSVHRPLLFEERMGLSVMGCMMSVVVGAAVVLL